MRRDGHEVTIAARPNVINLDGYLQLADFDEDPMAALEFRPTQRDQFRSGASFS